MTTVTKTDLCTPCAVQIRNQRLAATGVNLLPSIVFSLSGFGRLSLVVLGCYGVYVTLYGRYTWADHFLFGRSLIESLHADFEEIGEGDRSLPSSLGLAFLRAVLAFAVPVGIAIAWVSLDSPR